ncbi:DUF6489 family protein [Phenylobacterium sp.]|jgi:hypothetical protein|uniref:DUF6489 family protein n=1 Tax=Phenylobacterium sp. TaxID=1871053 RepID=UPI002F93FEA4
MKMTIEVDCTPEEARRFMGLPDITPLNEHLVGEMQKRVDANISLLNPEDFLKNWLAMGQGAQEQFRRMMEGSMGGARPKE